MWEVYVYYRQDSGETDQTIQVGRLLQQQMQALTGITGRLLIKKDPPDTLMEIYSGIADVDSFCSQLEQCASACYKKLMAIQPDRHIEIFHPISPES